MNTLPNLLRRQLERLDLSTERAPRKSAWQALIDQIAATYTETEQERYLLERSQEISSREMQALNEMLQRERDTLETRVRERTAALQASEARFRSFTSLGSDWYWEQDAQFRFTTVSRNLFELMGTPVEDHLGRCRWEIEGVEPPEGGWDKHRATLEAHLTFRNLVLKRRLPGGRVSYALLSGEPVFDANDTFTGYRGVGTDVTSQKIAEENISRLAHYDTLTGLYNRGAFFGRLEHALSRARRRRDALAVLFIDLDRFKDVNDAFGHVMGDDVLKVMADRVAGAIRESDTVGRIGGDEFIVLAEHVGRPMEMREFGQRLIDTLSEPFVVQGKECRLGASVGIALFPQDGEDATTLLKKADIAMYRAKQAGRNGYTFYSDDDQRPAEQRIVLGAGIRRALDHNQFVLHYQPKVSACTGVLTGVEALVRWKHPERGLLLPDAFIPLAEDAGLIRHVGRWVMRTACLQALEWQSMGLGPLRVAINLSPREFNDESLVIEIAHALAQTGLPPGLLELEVTESMMMEHAERAAETLLTLQSMGVHVSIDDFGTGYSSLARLKKFPIESVKIDRSFIRDIATDPDDAAIVSAVIAMAHSLRLKVVAEGVETAEQVTFLRERRCDEMQGYFFSRPVPANEIFAFARRHGAPQMVSASAA